jgi:Xaa-Pro aminopeptidase
MPVTDSITPTRRPDEMDPMEVAPRLHRLREGLDAVGVDALVVSNLTNVRYLTGFTGSSAMVLVGVDRTVFVTDGRYRTQSEQELAAAGVEADIVISTESPEIPIAEAAAGVARLGLEADDITWSAQRRWSAELFGGDLVPTTAVVEALRLVKDPGEAVRIRAACAIADAALAECRAMLGEEPTERAFALVLESTMLAMGADDLSFDTIVAAGPNGAKPHHQPSERVIRAGDLVVIDFGALVDGYHSDMTRTVAVGDPSSEAAHMLEVVLAAQAAGVEAVRAGTEAATVDAVCRGIIADAGLGDAFVHGTGHGVGLDIHEEPRVSSRSAATLAAGHVVTVEPGVYLPDVGGVRIEDTVLVTDDGCDRLTLAPRSPELIPTRSTV